MFLKFDTRDGGNYEDFETVTSFASASQCLGCGRRRPARMSAAKLSETPSIEAKDSSFEALLKNRHSTWR